MTSEPSESECLVVEERVRRIGILRMSAPPVNALAHRLRKDLVGRLNAAEVNPDVDAIVVAGSGRGFSAGADISEFGTRYSSTAPTISDVIDAIEACMKPVIAAIHGVCMGGGLELALGCHFRVTRYSAKIAFPEVKLGLLPGAGGTQRLPRLIGLEAALHMVTSGATYQAADPLLTGLFDHIVTGHLADRDDTEVAVRFAESVVDSNRPRRRACDLAVAHPFADGILALTRQSLAASGRHFPAPGRCVDALAAAVRQPFATGLRTERRYFIELVNSVPSRALRHSFLGEREAARIGDVPEATPLRQISQAAVIGAGTMGSGIALSLASADIPVLLFDLSSAALDRGIAAIDKILEGGVERGRIDRVEAQRRRALICPTRVQEDLRTADLIIEAVFEDMEVKRTVFHMLDQISKSGAILATNTSSLDVNAIAALTSRPQDVVGLHFFSPANVMRLLEIVRGRDTARDVLATSMALAKRLQKVAVVAGVCDGFIGNRMLDRYMRQANYLLEEGALPQQVDRALEAFGMAMGPFRVADLAGIDVMYAIRRRREVNDPGLRRLPIADQLFEKGRLGQKVGRGFYRYGSTGRDALPDPEVEQIVVERSRKNEVVRRIEDSEIVNRCILALVNEGARLLEEGIAQRASDIDVVYLNGYGFPRHRGGPMFYADTVGLYNVVGAMRRFARNPQADPTFWQPAARLEQLAASGGSLNPPRE